MTRKSKTYPGGHPYTELLGQRFGVLVVEEIVVRPGFLSVLKCRCDCGETRIVKASFLRSRAGKRCNCRARNYERLIGTRWGRLVVLSVGERTSHVHLNCVCDCGNTCSPTASSLHLGKTRSCGCLKRDICSAKQKIQATTHGRSNTRTFKSWMSMRQRCYLPTIAAYARYGGRGIRVCERWNSFANFLADMGERPPGTSIERCDNDKGYEPANCRWATSREQSINKSSNRLVTAFGETKPVVLWTADPRCAVSRSTLCNRLRRKWPVADAISMAPLPKGVTHA